MEKSIKKFNLEYLHFDISKKKYNNRIFVVGTEKRGKTTLIKNILNSLNNTHPTIVVSQSNDYKGIIPDKYIFKSSDAFELAFIRQQLIYSKNNEDKNLCFVMDDYLTRDHYNNRDVSEMIFNGICSGITTIFTIHPNEQIAPEVRSQWDYFFIFSNENLDILKKIWEKYIGASLCAYGIKKFEDFCKIYKFITEKYGVMVIRSSNYRRKNKLYYYKSYQINFHQYNISYWLEEDNIEYSEDDNEKYDGYEIL